MSSLPPELLYQILSGLYHNGYSLTRAHFAQYALVSKAFAGVVQKLLYETIEIKLWRSGTTPHNFLSSLDAQLTRYPHLKAYVQHVVIDFRGVIDVASTLDPGTDSEGGALINVLESIPGLKSMTLRSQPSPVALERMFGFRELVEYFRGGGEEEREFKGDSHSEEVVCGNGSGSGEHRGYRAQKLQLAIAEFATRGPAYKYVKQQFAGVPPGRVEVVGLAGRPVYARWWMCFPKVAAFGD